MNVRKVVLLFVAWDLLQIWFCICLLMGLKVLRYASSICRLHLLTLCRKTSVFKSRVCTCRRKAHFCIGVEHFYLHLTSVGIVKTHSFQKKRGRFSWASRMWMWKSDLLYLCLKKSGKMLSLEIFPFPFLFPFSFPFPFLFFPIRFAY